MPKDNSEKPKKCSIAIRHEKRLVAKQLAVDMASTLGRNVRLNELLAACISVAGAHRDDLAKELTRGGGA